MRADSDGSALPSRREGTSVRSHGSIQRLGTAILALALASCGARKAAEPALPSYRAKTIVTRLEKHSQDLASFGTIAFRTKTNLTAGVEGSLAELSVVEGSVVEAGALLARLENAQLEMRRRQSESALASARSSLELAQARLHEGQLQVEARVISIAKARIQVQQKEYEVAEMERSLVKKRSLHAVGGATDDEVNSLLVSLSAQKSALAAQRKDLEIQMVGLRDEDLAARGWAASASAEEEVEETERKDAMVTMNTRILRAEVDVARAQVESAVADLDSVAAMLGELGLRAPSSGVVGAIYAERGEHLQQGAKVMTLMDTEEVYAVFPVQESDAGRIKEGMPVQLSVDACKGQDLVARIDRIAPVFDAQTGAVTVKALLRNPAMRLRPGMFVRVRVDLGAPRDVVRLPASAIAQKKGAGAKVFSVVNGRAFLRQVELGRELDGSFIVEKGLRPGEVVIDSPSPLLKEGEDVETEG